MLVVTPKDQANELISRLLENRFNEFEVVGISYTDSKISLMKGYKIYRLSAWQRNSGLHTDEMG